MARVSFWKETPRGTKRIDPSALFYVMPAIPRIGETFILPDPSKNDGEYEMFTVTRVVHFPDNDAGTVRVVGKGESSGGLVHNERTD